MQICSKCEIYPIIKKDLCVGCYNYQYDTLKREVAHKLKIGTLLLLMDISANPGISYRNLRSSYTSDGSLSSHSKVLEQKKLITIVKEFYNKKPRTSYYISKEGERLLNNFKQIFEEYALKRYELNN